MYVINHARGRGGGGVSLPFPGLGDGTAYAVGHILQCAIAFEHVFAHGIDQRAIYVGEGLLLRAQDKGHCTNGYEVGLQARQ